MSRSEADVSRSIAVTIATRHPGSRLWTAVIDVAVASRGDGAIVWSVDRRKDTRVERTFTREQAQAMVPDILERAVRLAEVRAELVAQTKGHNEGADVAIADIKALEARMSDLLDGYRAWGLRVTSYAPLLLDFPTTIDGRDAFLCWLENEPSVDWWHELDHGFMGRRRL